MLSVRLYVEEGAPSRTPVDLLSEIERLWSLRSVID
jgi:hypothetical protein